MYDFHHYGHCSFNLVVLYFFIYLYIHFIYTLFDMFFSNNNNNNSLFYYFGMFCTSSKSYSHCDQYITTIYIYIQCIYVKPKITTAYFTKTQQCNLHTHLSTRNSLWAFMSLKFTLLFLDLPLSAVKLASELFCHF